MFSRESSKPAVAVHSPEGHPECKAHPSNTMDRFFAHWLFQHGIELPLSTNLSTLLIKQRMDYQPEVSKRIRNNSFLCDSREIKGAISR